MNVEHEMYDYTGINRSDRNSNKGLWENLEIVLGKRSILYIQYKTQLCQEHHT